VPGSSVNLVNGYGHTAGAAITAHPDVEKVAFTGSTEVGRVRSCMPPPTATSNKVTLELGGKSPVVIYDDANLDLAIPMASFGTFIHSGQGPVCAGRASSPSAECYERCRRRNRQHCQRHAVGRTQRRRPIVGPLISPEAAHPRAGLPRSVQV